MGDQMEITSGGLFRLNRRQQAPSGVTCTKLYVTNQDLILNLIAVSAPRSVVFSKSTWNNLVSTGEVIPPEALGFPLGRRPCLKQRIPC